MKKAYSIFLCLLFLAMACNVDPSPKESIPQPNEISSVYETITHTYQQKQDTPSTLMGAGIWEWFKKIATADALAAAAYAAKNGMKSDWKEALLVGAAASVQAALSGKSASTTTSDTSTKSYQSLVLSDIQQIKSAVFSPNVMDDLGYTHYILVNEVLKDKSLAQLAPSELQGAIYDKVYDQAQKMGIQAIYDKQEAMVLLNQIQHTIADNSNPYYTQLFTFDSHSDHTAFKTIEKLYSSTFNKIKSPAVFTAYSKEMEMAVIQDAHLSQKVKDVLLLEMATYRFGYMYYTINK